MESSVPPLPLADGLFVGRPSTSRLQLHTRTRKRRCSNSRPSTAAGIPRASSVPLLCHDHIDLEVNSRPVSLATRSLTPGPNRTRRNETLNEQKRTQIASRKPDKPRKQTKSSVTNKRGKMAAQFSGWTREYDDPAPLITIERFASTDKNEGKKEEDVEEEEKRVEMEDNGWKETINERSQFEVVAPAVEVSMEELSPRNRHSGGGRNRQTDRMKEGSGGDGGDGGAGDEVRERAARRIQRWYLRGKEEQKRVRMTAVHQLLREKKSEFDNSLTEQQLSRSLRKEKEERKKRKQEKMAATRQAAILSLQQKREEKRKELERIAQEEIALLQANSKIKKERKEKRKKKEREKEEKESVTLHTTPTPTPPLSTSPVHQTPPTSKTQPLQTTPTKTPPKTNTSTYTDILNTLRLLEEAPPPLPRSKSDETPPIRKPSDSITIREMGGAKKMDHAPSNLSESKLQSILSYLDEMGKEEEEVRANQTNSTAGEGLDEVASDVTSTILSQRMEIENKNKTVEMLQKALHQQRELTVYHAREMEKEGERRLGLQRQELETTIQRHQTFIDQLIEDKKKLGGKCEKLVKELRESSNRYQTKIKTMEETHTAELTKVKQVTVAADKLRREKWRTEESQRIKEATVRSLEPEIQRIIQRGKADVQRLKAKHEAELLEADERAGRRFVAQMEELRAQCAAEKEKACAHERELARLRYEKLAEEEEKNAQQQRRRLFAELEQEREKMAAHWDQQRQQIQLQQAESLEAHGREVEDLQTDHSRVVEEMERRHNCELRTLEERLTTEKQAWQENFTRRQETIFLTKEREMRESLRHERDKEIEMVIGRLEAEAEATRSQNEQTADARIKRIREKCEAELTEVERLSRNTQEKLTEAKRELGEREGEVARLRSLLRQKEEEVRQVGGVAERLTRERDNVTDVVRQEFADRLVLIEEENRRMKLEMSELKARQKLEKERNQREKERELEEVHTRVRQALEKKEEVLSSLKNQHAAALRRADHLEMLLERQRRELLKK